MIKMKTIAIIESCDTKFKEAKFISDFIKNEDLNTIVINTATGPQPSYNYDISKREMMETASIEETKLGKAYFLTVLDGDKIQKCEIEITKLNDQDSIKEKGIEFTVTDQEVINKANGIVQGMSGSPIIQNNKIVGCVTHVSGNNPIIGYGLYIDWMLEMDK